ncbi:MAG: hypothetical protein HC905_29095 [Bacteroidales bacterium]|nr:hypothetical protein [Bacteroidales bacterium]
MPTSSSNVSTTSRDWTNKCRTTKLQLTTIVVFFFGAFGFLISCTPYKNIDFQILRPAQIKLGPGYEKVEIHCEFCDDPEPIKLMDSLSRITARTSMNFIHSLKENLGKSPLFRDSSLYFINSEKLLAEIKRYKTRIKENTLIIILDSIALTDTVIEQRGKYSANNVYTYGVIHKFGCKIYDKSSMVLLSNYLLEDTVFELAQVSPWPYTTEDFSFDNTAWNTGVLAGEKYAHYLAPHWIDQTRIFLLRKQ